LKTNPDKSKFTFPLILRNFKSEELGPYDSKKTVKPYTYIWHYKTECFEYVHDANNYENYYISYYQLLNDLPEIKLYIPSHVSDSDDIRLLIPCPRCTIPEAVLPIDEHKAISIIKMNIGRTWKKTAKMGYMSVPDPLTGIMFSSEAFTKPQLVHFPNGDGTYWVLKNPKGGWDKVRDMTRDEEISYLPNHGNFSYWSVTNKKGYDGFEDSNGFLVSSYKNSFIWSVTAQDWNEITGQILNNKPPRTDL